MVSQQGIRRADRHRATVSQSLVHSPSLPQLWPLLCWFTRHDEGKGVASFCIFVCVKPYFCTTVKLLTRSLLPGVLWHLASFDGRAGTLLWPCNPWWQGMFFYFIYLTLLPALPLLVNVYTLLPLCSCFILILGGKLLQSDWLYFTRKGRHQSNTVSG